MGVYQIHQTPFYERKKNFKKVTFENGKMYRLISSRVFMFSYTGTYIQYIINGKEDFKVLIHFDFVTILVPPYDLNP